MILIYDCPFCGRENESTIYLEKEFDYIEAFDYKELEHKCLECGHIVELELELRVCENQREYDPYTDATNEER